MTVLDAPDTIGSRAAELRSDLGETQQGMANRLGMSLRAWQKIERDEGVPSGETLLLFRNVNANPGWVLSGLGPKWLAEDKAHLYQKNAIIDSDLLIDIKRVVAGVHKEIGITLRADTLDRKAIDYYNQYMLDDTDLSDAEEMKLWLGLLEKRIRREAIAARDAPGTGKRSAS